MPDRPTSHVLRARLAINLAAARAQAGMTQEGLAEAAGMARTYVSEVERLKRNITLDVLERFGAALEIDPLDLLK